MLLYGLHPRIGSGKFTGKVRRHMFDKIKDNIFSIHGVVTSLIHLCLIAGAVTLWVGMQVYVLGNDPMAQVQTAQRARR